MNHHKIPAITISMFCLIAAISAIGMAQTTSQKNNQPLGLLMYDPTHYEFGNVCTGSNLETVFVIWNGGGCCSLTFSIAENYDYVTVFPMSGTSNGEPINITVDINTSGLPLGTYPCAINITSDGGNGIFWANFSLVQYPNPTLQVTPAVIDFGFVPNGENATSTLYIQNIGCGDLTYTVSKDADATWLTVTPIDGDSIGETDAITLTAHTQGLTPQQYDTILTVNSNGGSATIPVTMNLTGVKIEGITGSKGKISAVLTNIGHTQINEVRYNIHVKGGIFGFLDTSTSGVIHRLYANSQAAFATARPFKGLGLITITIKADYAKTVVLHGRLFFNVVQLVV